MSRKLGTGRAHFLATVLIRLYILVFLFPLALVAEHASQSERPRSNVFSIEGPSIIKGYEMNMNLERSDSSRQTLVLFYTSRHCQLCPKAERQVQSQLSVRNPQLTFLKIQLDDFEAAENHPLSDQNRKILEETWPKGTPTMRILVKDAKGNWVVSKEQLHNPTPIEFREALDRAQGKTPPK